MPRQRNRGVAYTGTPGVKVRPPRYRTSRRIPRPFMYIAVGGPLDGKGVALQEGSCTLPISVGGQCGRYVRPALAEAQVPGSIVWRPL